MLFIKVLPAAHGKTVIRYSCVFNVATDYMLKNKVEK